MNEVKKLDRLLSDLLCELHALEHGSAELLDLILAKASSEDLKLAIIPYSRNRQERLKRLEQSAELLGTDPFPEICRPTFTSDLYSSVGDASGGHALLDAMYAGVLRRLAHFLFAEYSTAIAMADVADERQIVEALRISQDENGAAVERFSTIFEDELLPACPV